MLKTFSQTIALACLAAAPLFPQDPNVEDAIAAGGCLACGGTMMLIPIIILGITIGLAVWVARDAKARGLDNTILWVLLVLFTNVIGLIVYLVTRPAGELMACPSCGKKRLEGSAKCPHCGNA